LILLSSIHLIISLFSCVYFHPTEKITSCEKQIKNATPQCPSLLHINNNTNKQWGTWKSGVSLLNTGIQHPGSVMKNVIPIVMAGVIGIYGLIVAVILAGNIPPPTVGTGENIYSVYTGMAHLCAGLCCGLSGLAAGGCIGIIGDYGVRSVGYRTSNISVIFSTDKSSGFDGGDDDGAGSGDENKLFVGMLIMLIFSEALAL
jgi:V-type H+-transporting ATPase proteolipid subunit